ncbi:alpha-hydroxy acid oxidase [Caballeronia sp. LZ028]|uniref:alpha-hydroxy acid oxidase n=1 Tax=Caballeronia sp. LZ028 TaxID=3038563 RepID=UPI0028610918|nr:alpha-hydroxy acid oxidase [Caballeronia sp. LZ028]MDR5769899.1 alpha-hydroxy acid oxidase [Caballeronia sp. LZ028]
MSAKNLGAYNIEDLRVLARRRVPKGVFEFVDRGSEDEVALRNNRDAFERIKLVPRTLVDVSRRTTATELFGHRLAMPVAVAPTGVAGLMWYQGELELARAAAAAGIPFTLATGSMTAMETIASEAPGRLWFQLYMWPDRAMSHALVERARLAGFEALVVTVDGVVAGNREYNMRNGFTVPFTYTKKNIFDVLRHPRWMIGVLGRYMMNNGLPRYENYPTELKNRITAAPVGKGMMRNDSLTWDDLRELRRRWPHTLIVKGIMHPRDALLARACGADAVVVSNHGGRNVDSTQAPIDALPRIADAVGNDLIVLMDSGVRRGSDVVKALALGAKAVMIGRPTLYGTAVSGAAGAGRAIGIFREEIDRMLAHLGCATVNEVSREHVTSGERSPQTLDPAMEDVMAAVRIQRVG